MAIRNLMEGLVLRIVQETCDDKELQSGQGACIDQESRYDVACYVLNRIPQQYVSSSRGAAHAEKDLKENPQLLVDVTTLVHQGLRRVTEVRRPYYGKVSQKEESSGEPVFIFPTIKGRVLDCTTFAPLSRARVHLLWQGEEMPMLDERWQNPFELDPKLEGTFLFLPRPLEAKSLGESKLFDFEIRIEDPDYEDLRHFFKIALTAGKAPDLSQKVPDFKLTDIFAAPI